MASINQFSKENTIGTITKAATGCVPCRAGTNRHLRTASSAALGDSAGALAREASSYEKHALKRQLLEAFLLYALDDIHAAHSIFQEDDSFFGSYGHGMMHRREGDFWNANYWFRRAGNPRHLCFPDNRSPSEITAICEKAMGSPRMLPETIHLLHQEWVLLLGTLLTTPSADL